MMREKGYWQHRCEQHHAAMQELRTELADAERVARNWRLLSGALAVLLIVAGVAL